MGAFLEPVYALFTAGTFLIFWALYFGFFYVNSYATTIIGLSDITGAYLVIIISAIGIPLRPLVGLVADRKFGVLPWLVGSATFLGVILYFWIPVQNVAGMYIWSVAYGFATGAVQGLFPGGLASLTTDLSKVGTRSGTVCTVLAFASLAGPPTAGALIQTSNGSYTAAQVWSGTVTIAGGLFIAAAKWLQREKPTIKKLERRWPSMSDAGSAV